MSNRTPKGPELRLDVTQEAIDHAMPRDSRHCMIADTLKTARPDAKSISVDLATIRFSDPRKGLRYTFLTPRVAQIQLVEFDRGRKPEPFTFLLRGAHVTRMAMSRTKRMNMSDAEKESRRQQGERLNKTLGRTKLVSRHKSANTVPDRVGGKTPPLQRDAASSVPFSRRRAFGLRGLEY